jgi:Zn-dependent peptidase ImmA (M78 family)
MNNEIKDLINMILGVAKYVFGVEGYDASECSINFKNRNENNAYAFVDVDAKTKKVLPIIHINPINNEQHHNHIVKTIVHEMLHVVTNKRNHTISFKREVSRLTEIVWKELNEIK